MSGESAATLGPQRRRPPVWTKWEDKRGPPLTWQLRGAKDIEQGGHRMTVDPITRPQRVHRLPRWVGLGFGVVLLVTAGCVSPADAPQGETGTALPWPPNAPPQQLTWDGYLRVGAMGETAGHMRPSADLTEGLWRPGFVLEIVEAPDVLEVTLNWTSDGPANLYMVVHAPVAAQRSNESGFPQYNTHAMRDMLQGQGGADSGPLCMSIPHADVLDDMAHVENGTAGAHAYWYVMAHSHAGLNVDIQFTVTTVGGAVSIPDVAHGYNTDSETLQNVAETLFVDPVRRWDNCSLSV